MKKVRLFHFERCPYCRMARRWLGEILAEMPVLQSLEIEMIDERKHPEIARQYDYWLVPTFFVDEKKVHEGVCTKTKMIRILQSAAE